MNMRTISEAARALEVSRQRISRAIAAGELHALRMGKRDLVDMDEARPWLDAKRRDGIGVDAVSTATGLTVCAIRQAVRDGWLPSWKDGRGLRFDLTEVFAAMDARMRGNNER